MLAIANEVPVSMDLNTGALTLGQEALAKVSVCPWLAVAS